MKRELAINILFSFVGGAMVWALSPFLSGQVERWDAKGFYYSAALLIVGLIVGLARPKQCLVALCRYYSWSTDVYALFSARQSVNSCWSRFFSGLLHNRFSRSSKWGLVSSRQPGCAVILLPNKALQRTRLSRSGCNPRCHCGPGR